jgi:hypothetical protein
MYGQADECTSHQYLNHARDLLLAWHQAGGILFKPSKACPQICPDVASSGRERISMAYEKPEVIS